MDKKSFLIAAFSVFVQYYDYHLFGFLAAKIAKYFVPTSGDIAQLLNVYLIMAFGVISKPIGALVLGKIGDLYGRSKTFAVSLIGTAIASIIISLTPSYESIGLTAAFILLFSRMTTCALVSSGSDGVRIYIYEHMNKKNQCLGIGLTAVFTQAGSFAAAISAWYFTLDSMPLYSWRIAFLLGAVMGALVVILKQKLTVSDSINIKSDKNFEQFRDLPTIQVIKQNLKLFLLCILIAGGIGSIHQFIIIFFGTYNFEVLKNINHSSMQFYTAISVCIYMFFSPIGGYIADKIGRNKTVIMAVTGVIFVSLIQIYVLSTNTVSIKLFLLTSLLIPFTTMPAAAILKESIPVVIRYRIFSLSHAIGSIFISAPTAFLATWIYYKSGVAWLPMVYFITVLLILFLSLIILSKNFK